MGACLSSAAAAVAPAAATPARQLSCQDPEEARRLARLEDDIDRAQRRNHRLRRKVEEERAREAASQDTAADSGDPRGSPSSSRKWSLQAEVGSHGSSISRPSPRHPSSASSRHFPGPDYRRRP